MSTDDYSKIFGSKNAEAISSPRAVVEHMSDRELTALADAGHQLARKVLRERLKGTD